MAHEINDVRPGKAFRILRAADDEFAFGQTARGFADAGRHHDELHHRRICESAVQGEHGRGGQVAPKSVSVLAASNSYFGRLQFLLRQFAVELVGAKQAVISRRCNHYASPKIKGLSFCFRKDFGRNVNQRDAVRRCKLSENEPRATARIGPLVASQDWQVQSALAARGK